MKKAISVILILFSLVLMIAPIRAFAADAVPLGIVEDEGESASIASVTYPYYTTASLNLRTSPGTSSPVITTMPSGARVSLATYRNGWAYLSYSPSTGVTYSGYASMNYLIPASSALKVRAAGTILYASNSTTSTVKATLQGNVILQNISTSTGSGYTWYYVKVLSGAASGNYGYVVSIDVSEAR